MSLILTLNLCNILIAGCGPGWKDDGTVKGYQQLLWQVKLPELLHCWAFFWTIYVEGPLQIL